MKKIYLVLLILTVMFVISNNNNKDKKVIIPKESIRFRVIANSDSSIDQQNKKIVASNLEKDVMSVLKDTNNLEDARKTLKNNTNHFRSNIDKTLLNNNIKEDYTINYGNNYFPEKTYRGVKYEAGEYESLVVTLGEGNGANFWCVLFPPLCLLEGEETTSNDVQYSSFIKEVIDKYFWLVNIIKYKRWYNVFNFIIFFYGNRFEYGCFFFSDSLWN
mgnify:FL=1